MTAKITLLTMEQYLNSENSSLFKDIVLPVSDLLDKDVLVNNILLECGEFEVLYSDPNFQKFATENFFNVHNRTIKKWVDALAIEYEPLENYNRTEIEHYEDENNIAEIHTTVDGLRKTTEVQGKVTSESHKGKETTTVDPPDTTDVKEYSQPYNSGQTDATTTTLFDKQTKTIISDSVTNDNKTVTVVEGVATDPDTATIQGDINNPNIIETGHAPNEKDTNTIVRNPRELHVFGNIGVTTSQQMLQSELDIALFNVYKKITNMYMCELVIPVYD